MPDMKTDKFIIVDIETTGLDPRQDMVLEVGVIVTDSDLQIEAENSWLVRENGWRARLNENPVVREMHEKSGLVNDIIALPGYSDPDRPTEAMVALFIWRWLNDTLGLEAGVYPMTGSSVHFDRQFLNERLIVAESFFHYRNIDVSSVRSLCSAFNPEVYAVLKSDARFQKENSAHRALPDARTTLAELTFYRDHFLMGTELNDLVEYVGDKEERLA